MSVVDFTPFNLHMQRKCTSTENQFITSTDLLNVLSNEMKKSGELIPIKHAIHHTRCRLQTTA